MLKRIVVPLDGSEFGEQALPLAIRVAELNGAEVDLVHVHQALPVFLMTQGAPVLDPALDIELHKQQQSYLESVAETLRHTTSVQVTAVTLDGIVVPTLVRYIDERHADLVAMATHGRGGMSRLWLGSVASEVVQQSSAPVLLKRPEEGGSTKSAPPFQHVLIPLDGSPEAEEAIDHATQVAGKEGVTYLLLRVLPPIDTIGNPPSPLFPDDTLLHEVTDSYLRHLADQLKSRGYSSDFRTIRHGNTARAILQAAKEDNADLIALDTHRDSGGVKRLLIGGVSDKVLRASPVPVLMHRPRIDAVLTGDGEARAHGDNRA
jgi:nucleotide-binding universal stress UspA family protein